MNVFFRQIIDGKPTKYVGFASASTERELFWIIDEHLDPFSVELIQAPSFSVFAYTMGDINDCEGVWFDAIEMPNLANTQDDGAGWFKPEWAGYPYSEIQLDSDGAVH